MLRETRCTAVFQILLHPKAAHRDASDAKSAAQLAHQVAACAVRQPEIADEQVERRVLRLFQRLRDRMRALDLVTPASKQPGERRACVLVILDEQKTQRLA